MPPNDNNLHLQNSGRIDNADTIVEMCRSTSLCLSPILDLELYDACDSANVEDVGNLIRIRTKDINVDSSGHISYRSKYYKVLDFTFNELESVHYDYLFKFIIESLKGKTYEEACLSLLVTATRQGCSKNIDALMKCKQYFDIDAKDSTGNTALHYAVQYEGSLDQNIVKTLIRNGASMNVRNKEDMFAIEKNHPNTIEDILDKCIEEYNSSNNRRNENYKLEMEFSIFSHRESLQEQITKLSGELSETRDDLKSFRSISNLTSSTRL